MGSDSNNSNSYMFYINNDTNVRDFQLIISRLMKDLESEKIDNVEQFKEDVYCVIKRLSESHVSSEELTATEMMIKNREYYIQAEKEKRYKMQIAELEKSLEDEKNKKEMVYKTLNTLCHLHDILPRQAVMQKIQEVKAMKLGKVGEIIIKILKELLEE